MTLLMQMKQLTQQMRIVRNVVVAQTIQFVPSMFCDSILSASVARMV